MATPSSPPKRPRLSLQIEAIANGGSCRTSRRVAAAVDVKSPTAFNTLSNFYATAVDRSTPVQENPPTAILGKRPVLRLQTQDAAVKDRRTQTPYLGPYLDTPVTAQAISPAVNKQICFPSAMTATPPLSAQPPEQNGAQVFTFDNTTTQIAANNQGVRTPVPQNPKRRSTMPAWAMKLPYTHPRSLRSILRNSPLPPLSTKSPESPRRQSLRLQEKAARRVAYNSPLTQTITTSKYVKSHIDLLAEDATPISPSMSSSDDSDMLLDQAMADAGNDTRDGGQTPGPFEDMRRRMANMHASTPVALSPTGGGGGIRKRGGKRREKKRRWVWTIGQDEYADEGEGAVTPATAVNTAATVERKDAAAAAGSSVPVASSVPVLAIPAPKPRTRNQSLLARATAATSTQVPRLSIPVPPARSSPPAASPPLPAQAPIPSAPPRPQQQQQPQIQTQSTRELTPIPPHLRPSRSLSPSPEPSSLHHSLRHLTPIPPSLRPSPRPSPSLSPSPEPSSHILLRHLTPDLPMINPNEPPTPSVESITSVDSSSAFGSTDGGHGDDDDDMDMSDVSSFGCVDEGCGGGGGHGKIGVYEPGWLNDVDDKRESGLGDGDVDMDEGTPTMTARPVLDARRWAPWRETREGRGVVL